MTKIRFFIISTILLSTHIYACMEQTEQCNKLINELEYEIKITEKNLTSLTEKDNIIFKKWYALDQSCEEFSELPLIPKKIMEWKISIFNKKISELKKQQASILKDKKKTSQNLNILNSQLTKEKEKLKKYKTITLKKIEIIAKGPWDMFGGPEIKVKLGYSKIARGAQDTTFLSKSLFEDLTNHDKIDVYDEDVTEDEYMGTIQLKKGEIPLGVAGDSYVRKLTNSRYNFNYTIEYEVEY